MTELDSSVRIDLASRDGVPIVTVQGVLDSATYRTVRDAVIKAAIEEPRAVVVDINRLHAPSASAWTVFSSARWHVSVWPGVPILLVCAQPQTQMAISRAGVTRYVSMHPTRELALDALQSASRCGLVLQGRCSAVVEENVLLGHLWWVVVGR